MEDQVLDTYSEDANQSNEDCLLPLFVEPLAFSMPLGATERQEEVSVERSTRLEVYSEWFHNRFNELDNFLWTSLKGLEEQATDFLLAIEAELHQRVAKEKSARNLKSSGLKSIRELRGLFSSINYDFNLARRGGNSRDGFACFSMNLNLLSWNVRGLNELDRRI